MFNPECELEGSQGAMENFTCLEFWKSPIFCWDALGNPLPQSSETGQLL